MVGSAWIMCCLLVHTVDCIVCSRSEGAFCLLVLVVQIRGVHNVCTLIAADLNTSRVRWVEKLILQQEVG